MPLLVAGPGVPIGRRFDPVKTPDLTATILDLAGARAPRAADGISLRWNIRNGDRGWTAPVRHRGARRQGLRGGTPTAAAAGFVDARTTIGMRTARYKLVRWATGAVELYDLERDPNELRNVARDPAYADVRDHLTRLWWRYRDCVGAACAQPLPARCRRGRRRRGRSVRRGSSGPASRSARCAEHPA